VEDQTRPVGGRVLWEQLMKKLEDMTQEEKIEAFNTLQIFIESAVESEQDEPKLFKLETELRIDLVLVTLKEIFGLQGTA
jgi:hypothetical protein